MTKLLFTCALGEYMKGTLDCFRNNPDGVEFFIEGADMATMEFNAAGLDRFFQVPSCTDPHYIDDIFDICQREKITALFPMNTNELEIFEAVKDRFEAIGTAVVLTTGRLGIANDKLRMNLFLSKRGVRQPLTRTACSYSDYQKLSAKHPDTKFCIKLPHSCGGRGFRVIGDEEYIKEWPASIRYISQKELENLFKSFDDVFMLQEYLPGTEYTVDVISINGKVVTGATKRNEGVEGIAHRSEVVPNGEAFDQCVKACEALSLDGNVGFDLKENADGVPYIIDINPRLTATVSLIQKAGLNLPYYGYRYKTCGTIPESFPEAKVGARLVRQLADYFINTED